jgi:hypothetical protein
MLILRSLSHALDATNVFWRDGIPSELCAQSIDLRPLSVSSGAEFGWTKILRNPTVPFSPGLSPGASPYLAGPLDRQDGGFILVLPITIRCRSASR